ncbi:MAG: hypothetical protein V1915_03380 [Candidatus Bathyarchaeota archaeon]
MDNGQRGRPSGRSNLGYGNLNSMVLIASKHGLDPKQLIDAFFEASENETSHCGSLKISCRSIKRDSAMFLITKGEKVVWQFPVNLEIIRNPEARESIKKIPLPEKKTDELRNLKISELRFGMKRVSIAAEIIDMPPARLVNTRWGSQALVSNVKVADETGTIRLGLWNNQIKMVHVGDKVEIKDCSVYRFVDEPQLKIGRKGTLSVIPELQIVKAVISR